MSKRVCASLPPSQGGGARPLHLPALGHMTHVHEVVSWFSMKPECPLPLYTERADENLDGIMGLFPAMVWPSSPGWEAPG